MLRLVLIVEILDGGVNGVATVKKEMNEPWTDASAAASDADYFGHVVVGEKFELKWKWNTVVVFHKSNHMCQS